MSIYLWDPLITITYSWVIVLTYSSLVGERCRSNIWIIILEHSYDRTKVAMKMKAPFRKTHLLRNK